MDTKGPIIVKQVYNVSREALWSAITEVAQMRQWFFNNIESFKPETGFETSFNVKVGDENYLHLWKLIEVIPLKKIIYNWKYKNIPGESEVVFEITEHKGKTQLTLTHSGTETFTNEQEVFSRESGVNGWSYFIKESLKEFLVKN